MLAKILFVSDLHKVCKDGTSIKGKLEVQSLIQEDLLQYIKNNGVTHVILLGDWYDRGFHDMCATFGAMQEDMALSNSVSGEVYLCVGNHFYLERDDNPEMYMIQPNAFLKPKLPIKCPEKPIFKVVNDLRIGTVKISFFHFNKMNKVYTNTREPDVTYHIGVYHDDVTLPTAIRQREGINKETSSAYLNEVYKNIDLGIHGHIHAKVGVSGVGLISGKQVPIIVPGSLGITQNSESYKHTSVNLPVLTIMDDSAVDVQFAEFSTHLDKLRFYTKAPKTALFNQTDKQDVTFTPSTLKSLPAYLSSRGYNERQLNLISAACTRTLNLVEVVKILTEDPK